MFMARIPLPASAAADSFSAFHANQVVWFPPSPKTVCGPSQLSATAVVAADMPAICLVSISGFLVGSPEGQVVSQQLHNQRRVLVRILGYIVKLCNGILKG